MKAWFDLSDLKPNLVKGILTVEVNGLVLHGPLVEAKVRQELLTKSGLEPWEVDYLIDDLYERFQMQMIAKLFAKRQKRPGDDRPDRPEAAGAAGLRSDEM